MNDKQAKVIQTRLKTRGSEYSLAQIREHVGGNYDSDELTESQVSEIVQQLTGSSLAPVDSGDISYSQKQTLVQQVATSLELDLPVDHIREISQQMNWALSDRSTMKQRIKAAIIAWVNHQVEKDQEETNKIMEEVEGALVAGLESSNQHFKQRSQDFSRRVDAAVEKFRTTEAEVLDLFQVPN